MTLSRLSLIIATPHHHHHQLFVILKFPVKTSTDFYLQYSRGVRKITNLLSSPQYQRQLPAWRKESWELPEVGHIKPLSVKILSFYHLLTLFRSYAETYYYPGLKSALLGTFSWALIPLIIQKTNKSQSSWLHTNKDDLTNFCPFKNYTVFKLHSLWKVDDY